MTGLPTIIPLSSPPSFLGQRWNLSVSDISKINKLYKCSQVAAQPEAGPEEAIKEKVMDFIPVQPEPCSAESNLASVAVRKTTEPILSSQKTVGKDLSTAASQLRRTAVAEQSVVVSAMTSKAREASREHHMPSKHVLGTTQTTQMKTKATGNVVKKAPASWTSQNPITGWQSRNQYLKAYTPSEQSPMETRVRAAPEMEQTSSSQVKGSLLSSVEEIHGATTTLGQKEASVEVSGSKTTVLEPTGEEMSTTVELSGSLDMGSNETDVGMGSPRSPLSEVEKHSKGQEKKPFHQAVTASMNERGSPAYKHPVENILANVASSSYSSSTLRNPTTISTHVELGEKPQGTKVEVLENIITVSGPGGREVEAESLLHEKSTAFPSIQPPSVKNIHEHGDVLLPRKETPVPEILEAQTKYMGWFTSAAPSSLQRVVTVHSLASELKENGSLDDSPSRIPESFSLLPPHLARNGYEREKSTTGGFGTVSSWHVTERRVEVESHTLDHTELPSQIPTWGKMSSLAIKTNVAVQPTEQSSTTAAGPGDNKLWSQASSDERHHPRKFITVGWSPFADVKRRTQGKTTETASMKTLERLPMTRKIDLGHRERPRRTTLARQFPTEPSGSQVSTQREETSSQPSSTLSRIAGAEHHKIQASSSTNRLRAIMSPKPCGMKLAAPVSRTLTSPVGYTTENFSSLNRQLKLGITGKRSPTPRIQESVPTSSKILQLGGERNTSPRNWGGFTKPGGRHGTSNSTEHVEEETLSVKMKEFTQTSPTKRAPEITVVSGTRPAAAPLMVGSSSHFFTILAHGKPTLNRPQRPHYLEGTDSVTHPESSHTGSLELGTETELPFPLNKTVPSAEGRSIRPARSTAGWTVGGTSLAKARVQEGTSMGLPSLEMQPTSLEETVPPLITGSLQSPEPVNLKKGSVEGRLRTATSSLPRNISLVGATVVLSTDLSSTIILHSRENQTTKQYDSRQITGIPFKPRVTNSSTLASTETHRTSHAGLSTRGSHEVHNKYLQFESGSQTKAKPLEEVPGPISDGKTSTHFPEETWKIFTKEKDAYASEETTAAKLTRIVSKGSEESHIVTTGATSLGVTSSSQLIPIKPSKETEESTIFSEKKGNVHRTSGPSRQSYSVALMPPRSNVATPKVVPSVLDVYNPHGTKKVGTAYVYHTVTKFSKGVLVPAGISLPQRYTTLDSAETGRRSSITYRAKGLEEATETPTRVKHGGLFPLATESSRQISETKVATILEEMTRSQKTQRNLEENESFLASNPIHLHHINKRSLLGIRATPPPFILSSPAPEPKLVHSNIAQVNPRRLSDKKLFPKKHRCKIVVSSSGGTILRWLLPRYLRGPLSHPAIGQDAALSVGKMTKAREPEDLRLRFTSKSKLWSLLQKSFEKKRGNKPGVNQRTTGDILISCSFKENLCGWKQSQNDSLDWVLEKEEEERRVESMEERSISGKPFRSLDGHISLKPSSHLSKQRAVLISPVAYGIRCVQFWYRSTGCATGKINFYAKLLNSMEWHQVRSVKAKQDIGWHQVTVYISATWARQVALEGIISNEVKCKAQIDDLALCQKPRGRSLH